MYAGTVECWCGGFRQVIDLGKAGATTGKCSNPYCPVDGGTMREEPASKKEARLRDAWAEQQER